MSMTPQAISARPYGQGGVTIDPKQALLWYTKAAEGGSLHDQMALAQSYATGQDLVDKVNLEQSFCWTQKAAEQGGAVQVETCFESACFSA